MRSRAARAHESMHREALGQGATNGVGTQEAAGTGDRDEGTN